MSTTSIQADRFTNENLVAVTQRVGPTWRCLLATTSDTTSPVILETVELHGDVALNEYLQSKQPDTVYSILPGSVTVCRTTTLPDIEKDQMIEALRLQAEAKFLGGTPAHRRAIGALDNAVGETNRVGLIVAWPERATIPFPKSLQDAFFIPDAAAIAALLDGLRPTEPVLYADPQEGSVTIALSHANGVALRATREDITSRSTFTEGISRVARETASAFNHTPAFTDALIESLQQTVLQHSFDSPILILPSVVTQGASSHLSGAPAND